VVTSPCHLRVDFLSDLHFQTNVKGVARRKEDSQSEAKEGRCPPLPLPSC
jgi:hypothetical protein